MEERPIFGDGIKALRSRFGTIISFAAHLLAIWLMVRGPAAMFIHPAPAAAGSGGKSSQIVYLAPEPAAELVAPRRTIYLARREPKLNLPREAQSKHRARNNANDNLSIDRKLLAGSPIGSASEGLLHDLRPALPLIFPDPNIARSELPTGVQGEVIVEVTIDAYGHVIATRLLQGLGYGVEDKIISTLQTWRFRPATEDGLPIASKQDVHFHLPS